MEMKWIAIMMIGMFSALAVMSFAQKQVDETKQCFKLCHEMKPDFEVYYDAKDGSCSCKAPK